MKFDSLVRMADKVLIFKYVVKNICRRAGLTASFMPKPLFQDNGSGMHVHQSLWKRGTNLFYDERGYAGLSQTARYYIGGLLHHAPALLAFAAPSTNSYRRLVPGFEAPVNLVYSQRNRSAAVRIPMYSKSPDAKRIEFRCPDPSCNPYLTFAALLMAGLDGVQNKIDPGEAIDKNLYDLPPEEKATVRATPASLAEALQALRRDHEFLLKGDVFTQDVIDAWIHYKTNHELDPVRLRPHPYEYFLYFDI
jgi:glutamine synthetase